MVTTTAWPVRLDASADGRALVPLNRVVAEQARGGLERAAQQPWDTGSVRAMTEECYESFEVVPLVHVTLEPAASSPFIDC
jgi:hypothetical protein